MSSLFHFDQISRTTSSTGFQAPCHSYPPSEILFSISDSIITFIHLHWFHLLSIQSLWLSWNAFIKVCLQPVSSPYWDFFFFANFHQQQSRLRFPSPVLKAEHDDISSALQNSSYESLIGKASDLSSCLFFTSCDEMLFRWPPTDSLPVPPGFSGMTQTKMFL